MKEVLNNQQIVCPGDATQFMHAISVSYTHLTLPTN